MSEKLWVENSIDLFQPLVMAINELKQQNPHQSQLWDNLNPMPEKNMAIVFLKKPLQARNCC